MNNTKTDPLAGKSQALKAALKAVERLGEMSARRRVQSKPATAKKDRPGETWRPSR